MKLKVTRHASNLVQLTRYPVLFPMNCYVVQEDDGFTLVDSTTSSPADALALILQEVGKDRRVTFGGAPPAGILTNPQRWLDWRHGCPRTWATLN